MDRALPLSLTDCIRTSDNDGDDDGIAGADGPDAAAGARDTSIGAAVKAHSLWEPAPLEAAPPRRYVRFCTLFCVYVCFAHFYA